MAHTARAYLVINPSALGAPGRRITFRHIAPAGATVCILVDGRPARVLLTDTLLPAYGHVYAAEVDASL